MDKDKLLEFLLKARTKTYAGASGEVNPALSGSKQLEYKEGDWLYLDVYFMGNNKFAGLETVYFKDKPVLSMSYYGNYQKMTEEEVDKILRGALIENWQTARLWKNVSWQKDGYQYACDGNGDIEEFDGSENITKGSDTLYYLYYAAGYIG